MPLDGVALGFYQWLGINRNLAAIGLGKGVSMVYTM
jgi:hypothetical protein